MDRKTMNVAIIGCGAISSIHVNSLSQLENINLTVVCDNKTKRADEMANRTGALAVYDYKKVLNDETIDSVHICLPHYLHAPIAMEALKAGKYVLCEKPMAISDKEALDMIAADDAVGGKLGIIFQNRYLEANLKFRDLVSSSKLGKLVSLRGTVAWIRTPEYYNDDWHGTWSKEGGGVLMNQAIHTLDLMQLVGGKALSVSGSYSTDRLYDSIEVEDTAHINIQFENGVTGLFYATVAYDTNAPVEIEAVMEKGTLLYREGYLYLWEGDNLKLLSKPEKTATGEKSYWGVAHEIQIADFYDSITHDKPIKIDGRSAYPALKIIQALYRSSRTEKPQILD